MIGVVLVVIEQTIGLALRPIEVVKRPPVAEALDRGPEFEAEADVRAAGVQGVREFLGGESSQEPHQVVEAGRAHEDVVDVERGVAPAEVVHHALVVRPEAGLARVAGLDRLDRRLAGVLPGVGRTRDPAAGGGVDVARGVADRHEPRRDPRVVGPPRGEGRPELVLHLRALELRAGAEVTLQRLHEFHRLLAHLEPEADVDLGAGAGEVPEVASGAFGGFEDECVVPLHGGIDFEHFAVGRGELRVADVGVEGRLVEGGLVLENRERAGGVDHHVAAILHRIALAGRAQARHPAVVLDDVLDHRVVVDGRARLLRAVDDELPELQAVDDRELPWYWDVEHGVLLGDLEAAVIDVGVRERGFDRGLRDRLGEGVGSLECVAAGDVARFVL